MSKAVKLPAGFTSISSRVDHSYKLTFDTRELGGDDAAELFKLLHSEGHLLFAPTDTFTEADIPEEPADASLSKKTQSQRLRGVLYRYWEVLGSKGDFDSFYRERMERIIAQYKEKLDG